MTGDPIQAVLLFPSRKAQGLAVVQRVGSGYAIVSEQFSPLNGSRLAPDVAAISMEQLSEMRSGLALQMAAVDSVMADIEALG